MAQDLKLENKLPLTLDVHSSRMKANRDALLALLAAMRGEELRSGWAEGQRPRKRSTPRGG